MARIHRDALLLEKASGNYSCPHHISPDVANQIASACNISLGREAQKALAEVAENFATEVIKACLNKQPTASQVRDVIRNCEIA